MTTAHETIRQALTTSLGIFLSDAERSKQEGKAGIAQIRDEQADFVKEALTLLETHAVVPREPSNEILEAATDTSGEDLERAVRKKENMADNYKAMIQQATQETNDEL